MCFSYILITKSTNIKNLEVIPPFPPFRTLPPFKSSRKSIDYSLISLSEPDSSSYHYPELFTYELNYRNYLL